MNPFSHILVPVDFSDHSDAAVAMAADVARRYQASIAIIHVYEPAMYALPEGFVLHTPGQITTMLDEFGKLLERAKQAAVAGGAERVETRQLQGIATSEIVDLAKRESFDLIVMGTHGRTGLRHAIIGSVAEGVVRRATCPVLTVKTEERNQRS